MLNFNTKEFVSVFLISLFICVGGGWLTGLITQTSVKEWYPTLVKPMWTPPDVVFPLAWTILYVLIALSFSLVWIKHPKNKIHAFAFFSIQLFLNFIWSWLFFFLKNPGFALFDIALLWLALLMTMREFFKYSSTAAYLLIPYNIWVIYAFSLNLFIWINN